MKKIGLIMILLSIGYLSNIPNLKVLDIHTWINQPHYEKNLTLQNIFQEGSPFYYPYAGPFNLEFYLHKLGHVSGYLLATLMMVRSFPRLKLRYVLFAIVIFAIADEIHQFFVVGRSGRLMDIALDSSVSLLFLLALKAKRFTYKQYKIMKKEPKF